MTIRRLALATLMAVLLLPLPAASAGGGDEPPCRPAHVTLDPSRPASMVEPDPDSCIHDLIRRLIGAGPGLP